MKLNVIDAGKLKGNKLNLMTLGDIHLGAKDCAEDKFYEYVKWISKQKDTKTLLMGDMINCGLRNSVGAGSYDDKNLVQDQMEEIVEALKPLKGRMVGLHTGNHEQRIFNSTGIDVSKIMAKDMGIPYLGWSVFNYVKVGDQAYDIYSTHGASGATQPHTKIRGCIKLSYSFDADIYLMGHVHRLDFAYGLRTYYDRKMKCVKEKKKLYGLTGHFLKYEDSYAEVKNLKKETTGALRLKLYKDKWDIHAQM